MKETLQIGVDVPEVQDHACSRNRAACVIHDPVANLPSSLQTKVMRFGFRSDLYVFVLGGVTITFNCQDIFTKLD